ncbi:Lon protease family protein [Besnoitia besnoiti]|uniref:Lon protease homolog n=1 Tax=Besnoitia besnoiti TaxID=94643 RepID=A0A2A9MCA7_BESBE|nr:Lon protease family protein [Besnoitia besnoiti]PFH33951.1 Lon protease family protein [Besnoitia besnoiti]
MACAPRPRGRPRTGKTSLSPLSTAPPSAYVQGFYGSSSSARSQQTLVAARACRQNGGEPNPFQGAGSDTSPREGCLSASLSAHLTRRRSHASASPTEFSFSPISSASRSFSASSLAGSPFSSQASGRRPSVSAASASSLLLSCSPASSLPAGRPLSRVLPLSSPRCPLSRSLALRRRAAAPAASSSALLSTSLASSSVAAFAHAELFAAASALLQRPSLPLPHSSRVSERLFASQRGAAQPSGDEAAQRPADASAERGDDCLAENAAQRGEEAQTEAAEGDRPVGESRDATGKETVVEKEDGQAGVNVSGNRPRGAALQDFVARKGQRDELPRKDSRDALSASHGGEPRSSAAEPGEEAAAGLRVESQTAETQGAAAPLKASADSALSSSAEELTELDVRALPSALSPSAAEIQARLEEADAEETPSSSPEALPGGVSSPRVGRKRRGGETDGARRRGEGTTPEGGSAASLGFSAKNARGGGGDSGREGSEAILLSDSASFSNGVSPLSALPPRFPVLSALPLFRRPAFPGFYQLLHIPDNDVFEALVRQKKSGVPGGDYVAGFLTVEEKETQQEEDEEIPGAKLRKDAGRVADISELHDTGSLLHLLNFAPHSHVKGGQVVVMPYRRVRLLGSADSPTVPQPADSTAAALLPTAAAVLPLSSSSPSAELEASVAQDALTAESLADEESGAPATPVASAESPSPLEAPEAAETAAAEVKTAATEAETGVDAKAETAVTAKTESAAGESAAEEGSRGDGGAEGDLTTAAVALASGEAARASAEKLLLPVSQPTGAPFSLLRVRIAYLPDESGKLEATTDTQRALHLEIVVTMKELLKQSYFYKEHFDQVVRFYNLDSPRKLADLVAGMSFAKRHELQAVLAEGNIEKRLRLVLEIAKKDLEFSKLQVQVKTQVEEKMNKLQRRFLLNEQLKFLKKELGEVKDDKESILDTFRELLEKKKDVMSEEAQKAVTYELSKMNSLDQASSEFNITRTYTDWLLNLPWGEYTEDCSDIFHAEKILNEDHYGLSDVKDRILEFIAITILKKDVQGKIICLVGPPGVGKTSVGQSIARALNRKFYRISLGGMCDVAELRGHRRTYIGALPGKVIQALKECRTMNPVILLDEIDKLGRDFRGDPSSALLEVLDPSQNKSFRDHYLDVPVDLSKILFVCTANTPDVITGPLLDRMEVIRIAGYIFQEKLSIAQNYLLPQTQQATGLTDEQIDIAAEVLEKLVRDYAREAGVRSLLKLIEKIYRKAALTLVRKEQEKVRVTLDCLSKFVGQPAFQSDRLYGVTPPGVVMGLAWTQMGGATLYVEAIGRRPRETPRRSEPDKQAKTGEEGAEEEDETKKGSRASRKARAAAGGGEGSFKVTGQLGAVMSESSEIALTFCRMFVRLVEPNNSFLETAYIHLHVPEGATPKDGPSAGITMATALVSLALDKPVLPDVAMTGELTLTGKVLKIGGVKEKVIAARRENVKTLIFPKANEREFAELPAHITEGLQVHFAATYDDVYQAAFGTEPPSRREEKSGMRGGV